MFFRCSHLLASLLLLEASAALQCGTTLTTPCLGETDIRYDPQSSNDAVDQAEVWEKFGGYFVGEGKVQILFDESSTELSPTAYGLTVFVNNTIIGSRLYSHRVEMVSIGIVYYTDTYATTTYEKDGKLAFSTSSDIFNAYPVDINSAFTTYTKANGDKGSESWYALDLDANSNRILSDQFVNRNGSLVLSKTYSAFEERVTKEVWMERMITAYNDSSIAEEEQLDFPMEKACFADVCPSEEEWCAQDPECSTSPYQEPSASMLPGWMAGFILIGIALLILGFYFLHRYLQARQAKRYKTVFAKRIAETITVNKSIRSMAPQELAEEFKRVDLQTEDGLITKDDLWEFISSGKAGEITQGDFNALFAAIDADGDGQVDFLAFCAFMGQCHDEYRAARADRANWPEGSSRRLQAAETTARASFRHLSMSANEDLEDELHADLREAARAYHEEEEYDEKKLLESQSIEVS